MKKLLLIALLIVGCDNSTEAEDCAGIAGGDSVIDCNGNCGGAYPDEYCGTVTDIDENTYKTIRIDNQIWMAENLKVTHYRNGEEILTGLNDDEWNASIHASISAYAVYNDESTNADIYGNLYNWYAVDDERGLCMEGWHVPTYDEFKTLLDYTGNPRNLIEVGNSHWYENPSSTNLSGFTAIAGGQRNSSYQYKNEMAKFWTSSNNNIITGDISPYNAYLVLINPLLNTRLPIAMFVGLSVRCLKD